MKEGVKGENLAHFLKNLFMACLGSDSKVEVKLKFMHSLQNMGRRKKREKDREVLISFEDFSVLDTLWGQPKIVVKGQEELIFYSDMSTDTKETQRLSGNLLLAS